MYLEELVDAFENIKCPFELGTNFNRIVIVLGKNWGLDFIGHVELSIASLITATAAAILIRFGIASHIIFSSGYTHHKYPYSEAVSMFVNIYPVLQELTAIIHFEEESYDTHTNAEEVSKLLENLGLSGIDVVLVTVGFHLERAKEVFERHGIRVQQAIASEDILKVSIGNSIFYKIVVEQYINSYYVKFQRVLEKLLGALLFIDSKGCFIKYITRRRLNRSHRENKMLLNY